MTRTGWRGILLAGGAIVLVGLLIVVLLAVRGFGAQAPRAVRLPPAGARFDYQLGGAYAPASGVRMVVRDRLAQPDRDRYSVCYVDAFQSQPEDENWWNQRHPDLLLRIAGRPVEDPNWPDQFLLDTSSSGKRSRLLAIVQPWISDCASRGFDAVELDNLDSWSRSSGRISVADNIAFAKRLAASAHSDGLAVAQKNAAVLGSRGRTTVGFDFAIAESCQPYDECSAYSTVYGRRFYEIEYDESAFRGACTARSASIAIILRDRLLAPLGASSHRYAWC